MLQDGVGSFDDRDVAPTPRSRCGAGGGRSSGHVERGQVGVVVMLTQQKLQLYVLTPQVLAVLPQSFTLQHSAAAAPPQLLQFREPTDVLQTDGQVS